MPIHNSCSCGIAPITGRRTGQVIDRLYAPEGASYEGWNKNTLRRYDETSLAP